VWQRLVGSIQGVKSAGAYSILSLWIMRGTNNERMRFGGG
jgi:hypothetical protein